MPLHPAHAQRGPSRRPGGWRQPLRRTAVLVGWAYAIASSNVGAASAFSFVEETEQDTIFATSTSSWITILLVAAVLAVVACIVIAVISCYQRRVRRAEASLRGDGIEKSIKIMTARLYRTRQKQPVDPLLALEALTWSSSPPSATPPHAQSVSSPILDTPAPLPGAALTRPTINTGFTLFGALEPRAGSSAQGGDFGVSTTSTTPTLRLARGSLATPGTASQGSYSASGQPNAKLQRESSFASSAAARPMAHASSMRVFAGMPKVEAMRRALGCRQLHSAASPATQQPPAMLYTQQYPRQQQQHLADEEAVRAREKLSLDLSSEVGADATPDEAFLHYPFPAVAAPPAARAGTGDAARRGAAMSNAVAGKAARTDDGTAAVPAVSASDDRRQASAESVDAAAPVAGAAPAAQAESPSDAQQHRRVTHRSSARYTAVTSLRSPTSPSAEASAVAAAPAALCNEAAVPPHCTTPSSTTPTRPRTTGARETALESGAPDGRHDVSEAAVPPVEYLRGHSAPTTGGGRSRYSGLEESSEEGAGSYGRFSASRRYLGPDSAGSRSVDLPRVHLVPWQGISSDEMPFGDRECSAAPSRLAAAADESGFSQERLHTGRTHADDPAEHHDPVLPVEVHPADSPPPEDGPDDTTAYWRLLDAQFADPL